METKLRIISVLEGTSNGIHLRGISRLVNSGLPNVRRFLEILRKENVVRREKEANLIKFKLNESEKTFDYLRQLHTEKFLILPSKIKNAVKDFLDEIDKPLISLIFGSYSKRDFNKDFNIDILLVFQKVEDEKEIENTAKRIGMRTNTKINPIYVDYKNFEKNFLDKEHDFSKEIRQDVVIILGIEYYYKLVWRFLK